MGTIQEDFDRIDVMLRQLQVKWDLFFNGAERKPPSELQTQVESLIRRLANSEIRNNGDRFRFQGLSARYTAFNELWQKAARAREGRAFGRHGIKAEESAPMRPTALAEALTHARHAEDAPGVPRGGRRARRHCSARASTTTRRGAKAVGEGGAGIRQLQALIGKQAEKIRAEKGAAAVDFRLETKDGKVSLKAKVVK